MKFGNVKKIKKAVLEGNLVVTARRYGKTRALLEIIKENPGVVLVVGNSRVAEWTRVEYQNMFGVPTENIATFDEIFKRRRFHGNTRLVLDEWTWYDWVSIPPSFKIIGGAASQILPIKIIKPTKSEVEYIKKEFAASIHPNLLETEFFVKE